MQLRFLKVETLLNNVFFFKVVGLVTFANILCVGAVASILGGGGQSPPMKILGGKHIVLPPK